jgi:tetratricopeptide (TPR) repeat protein
VRAPLVAVALAALGAPAHAGDFDATLAAAKARSVPVIVSFGSASCERCVEFETEVLPTPEVQAALRKAIFVSYDFHGEPGAKLARKYHVTTLPVFLAIDGEGRELLRLSGVARGTEWFVRFVRRARDLGADESSIEAELAGSREKAEVRLKAARWYRSRGRVREAIENYERAIEVAPDQAVAAEAAHDLAKLTAAVERRKRVVSDAVSFVHRFPESRRAAQELAVAVLSGDLGRERREELLRIAAARAPLKSLERVVYTALAAGDTANALLAAQRLAASELDRTQAYLALADAYLGDGDGVAAAQSHQIACREPPVVYREECAEQTRRFSDGGEIAAVAELRREVVSYFAVIEDPAVGVAAAAETMVGDPALAKFIPDMRQRFAAASRRCVKQRRGLDEVWVRLEMAGPKRRPKKVVVLEPGAPRELVDCLTSVLDAPVAVIPSLYRKRFVAPVRFRDDPTTPPEPDYDEPVIRGRMHHAYLYLSGMAGVADTLGAGTRAVVTALRFGHFDAMLSWDVNAGVTSEGTAAYGVRALFGVAARPPSEVVRLSLLSGVGASRIGDALPDGVEVPIEMVLTISHPRLRGLVWARTAWIFGAEERKRPSGNALFGGDEFSTGVGVRVPAASPYGTFLATAYSRYAESQTISIMLGTSVDSF